jgi:hypothetical protein
MNIRNFDLVKEMKMRTKSISALLLAAITMAPAAVIPATSYSDTVKTNFSHPISNVPGKSLVAVEASYPLVALRHRTVIRRLSMRTSSRVRSRAR